MAQLDALNPNDPARFVRQARIRAGANDAPGAIALYQQAIQAQQAAGQPIPPEWRQQIAGARLSGAACRRRSRYMREWLVAAPTPALWHDTLAIYRRARQCRQRAEARHLPADARRRRDDQRARLCRAMPRPPTRCGRSARSRRCSRRGSRRNLITTNAGLCARAASTLANRPRRRATAPSLAGERTAALAGSDGAAALRLGDAYYGYGEYAPGGRALPRGAAEGRRRRQSRQHPARRGAGAGRAARRGRDGVPRRHRPARRARAILAALAVDPAS